MSLRLFEHASEGTRLVAPDGTMTVLAPGEGPALSSSRCLSPQSLRPHFSDAHFLRTCHARPDRLNSNASQAVDCAGADGRRGPRADVP